MRVHFLGIGGIGVSALAQYYLAKGHEVSGSDLVSSEITEALKKKGVKIFIGKENPEDSAKKFDLVIYSPAVNYGGETSIDNAFPDAGGRHKYIGATYVFSYVFCSILCKFTKRLKIKKSGRSFFTASKKRPFCRVGIGVSFGRGVGTRF